ncbi:hypothetical protein HPG69_018384 [Diceros bicornis minor]|uniref:non-specific serine/threonine protein kinase n=1 Tax=Diceros bicornis minor TaxID=77932 RepID=A0A7J7FEU2_DICBM|nr:hypothetical protein HPG69_018384 [Diceros bicornis minor]
MSTRTPLPTVNERDTENVSSLGVRVDSPGGARQQPLQSGPPAPSTLKGKDLIDFNLRVVLVFSHTSHGDGRQEVTSRTGRSGARCRNSIASCADEQPHIGNYRLLKTIGKGNFAKVKLARHILTGRENKKLIFITQNHIKYKHYRRFGIFFCLLLIGCGCFNNCQEQIFIFNNNLFVAIKIIDKTQLNPTSLQKPLS